MSNTELQRRFGHGNAMLAALSKNPEYFPRDLRALYARLYYADLPGEPSGADFRFVLSGSPLGEIPSEGYLSLVWWAINDFGKDWREKIPLYVEETVQGEVPLVRGLVALLNKPPVESPVNSLYPSSSPSTQGLFYHAPLELLELSPVKCSPFTQESGTFYSPSRLADPSPRTPFFIDNVSRAAGERNGNGE